MLESHRHFRGETVAVHRQRSAGGHLVRLGRRHDERVGPAHLLVQKADGVQTSVVASKGIGAHELRQQRRLVRIGLPPGPHFVNDRGNASHRHLPGCFRSSKSAPDDMDRLSAHGPLLLALHPG
jgi:hypothetical protein